MLKPVVETINGVCKTIQTLRGNDELAAEILQVVRDDFRMVVRKIQSHPAAQTDAEFRRDVDEYFRILQDIVHRSLSKINGPGKRSKLNRLGLLVSAQKHGADLQDLRLRVQEARSALQAKLILSMAIRQTVFHNPTEQRLARTGALEDSPTSSRVVQLVRQIWTSVGLKDVLSQVPSTQPSGVDLNDASNLYIKSISYIWSSIFFYP
ncbi:hypothetical protein GYMLUDRAFT_70290 [Collybiopsis luxurians FD-317 M1]|nr:hypothetical protein GYMLUDRAFT_70290 [Collybiopsis luxurians FD-317 M1]